MKPQAHYRFGEFLLDPVAKVLYREGQPLHLTRKAVETLLVLVENAGQVVPKEEIIRAVWPDRVVEEANLAQNIAVIRKALGADPSSPAHIETFPGRGYRLEGPIQRDEEAIAAVAGPGPRPMRSAAVVIITLFALAGVAWLLWRGAPNANPYMDLKLSPWTRVRGKEFQPALSPDGQWLAFVWVEEGGQSPSVYVQSGGQDSPLRISSAGGTYSSPAWSPDGRRLAFLRVGKEFTEVILSGRDGAGTRIVARLSPPNYGIERRLMDWSPDGTTLVIAHADSPGRPLGLLLLDVESGRKRTLTEPAGDDRGDVDPRFSPDGRQISFIREFHRSRQELHVVSATGGPAIARTALRGQITGQDWAEDGQALLYASDQDGEYRIWRIDAGGGGRPKPLPVYGEFPIQLSVARKAREMAYAALHQDRNIWQLDLTSKTWKRVISSTAQDASPQFSPDGGRILFRSDRGGNEQLWVSDPLGGSPQQVTQGQVRPSVGRWAPDGRRIVFNDPVAKQICLVEPADGRWQARSLGIPGVHPVFSADGQWIYAGGLTEIVRAPAQGGPLETVAKSRAESLSASRDGNWIYFVREPNDTSLWRASVKSGEIEKVLDGLLPSCSSCYALAAEAIYFLGSRPETYDRQILYRHDLTTRRTEPFVDYPEPLWPIGSGPFSLSPDGKQLLTVRVDQLNSDVMRVRWAGE